MNDQSNASVDHHVARLAAIVESSDDAIVSKTLDSIITSWNGAAERMFGHTAAEAIGQSITMLIPSDRQDEEPRIIARIRAGERIDHFETVRQTKDGRLIDVSVTISPVFDPSGRILGVSKIARDITAQKRIEAELRAAKEAAELALAAAESAGKAKDTFLSVLSHELRTPLTPALLAISILERDPQVPPRLAEQVAIVRRSLTNEARLVDDLLDLTRIARGKMVLECQPLDAQAATLECVATMRGAASAKGVRIGVELDASDTQIWADPARFHQMISNLLSNALKFTPAGGAIRVRLSDAAGKGVRIEIGDNGIGIPAAVLPRLFRPFEQGEQGSGGLRHGGLGLGLSIVRSLADLHGASVTAASDGPGRGATFVLEFPLMTAAASAPSSAGAPPADSAVPASALAAMSRRRVLLVEDHADTRQMLELILGSFGCTVVTAGNVAEAIRRVDADGPFDLLISDIGLPDGTGVDVMRAVRGRAAATPGIALTGFGQPDDLRRSTEAGFAMHLVKPIDTDRLQQAILNFAS